jgi:hypothetical protein
LSNGPNGGIVFALAINPQTPNILYAGTYCGGVFKWPSLCPLTVGKAGIGDGSVASNPTGIVCGTDCSEAYAVGTPVALTATPLGGAKFTAWSGDCTGSGACEVSMDEPRSVTATFVPRVTVTATTALATDGGSPKGVFTFARTGNTVAPLTAYYTVSGTATAGTDYVSLGPSATFPAGASTVAKTVTPLVDKFREGNETVIVTLSRHACYTRGNPGTARAVVLSEEAFPQLR